MAATPRLGSRLRANKTGAANSYTLHATTGAVTSYQDGNLVSGQRYYYAVTAGNANGESAYSNYATVQAR